jgi:hypothetical protein
MAEIARRWMGAAKPRPAKPRTVKIRVEDSGMLTVHTPGSFSLYASPCTRPRRDCDPRHSGGFRRCYGGLSRVSGPPQNRETSMFITITIIGALALASAIDWAIERADRRRQSENWRNFRT